MQFPYGTCDFQRIIENNKLYIDRTHLIPLVERAGGPTYFPASASFW
jgi:hypothetical protein